MDERTWDAAILKLFEFFRVDKLPSKSQQDLWFESVKHIGNAEVDHVVAGITGDCNSLPRNIPKAFIEHRPASSGYGRLVQYDRIEDSRFPVGRLHDALRILETKGRVAFEAFCESVHMPRNDRERVENKHRICSAHEQDKYKIREIGTRLNRKTNRTAVVPLREFD